MSKDETRSLRRLSPPGAPPRHQLLAGLFARFGRNNAFGLDVARKRLGGPSANQIDHSLALPRIDLSVTAFQHHSANPLNQRPVRPAEQNRLLRTGIAKGYNLEPDAVGLDENARHIGGPNQVGVVDHHDRAIRQLMAAMLPAPHQRRDRHRPHVRYLARLLRPMAGGRDQQGLITLQLPGHRSRSKNRILARPRLGHDHLQIALFQNMLKHVTLVAPEHPPPVSMGLDILNGADRRTIWNRMPIPRRQHPGRLFHMLLSLDDATNREPFPPFGILPDHLQHR